MTNDEAELGAEVARELIADRDSRAAPQAAAAQFVKSLLAVNPRAKLPAIIANQKAKDWMDAARVTQSILREALAARRKELQAVEAETALKRPKRQKKSSIDPQQPSTGKRPIPQAVSRATLPASTNSAHSVVAPTEVRHADLYSDVMVPN